MFEKIKSKTSSALKGVIGKVPDAIKSSGTENENQKTSLLRRIKIRMRLILAFLLIATVPLLILGITSFTSAKTLVSDTVKEYTGQIVNQFGKNIETELNKITEYTGSFLFSSVIQDSFVNYDNLDPYYKQKAFNDIQKEMTVQSTQNRYIGQLRLYSSGGSELRTGTVTRNATTDYLELNKIFSESKEKTKWYTSAEDELIYARSVINLNSNRWMGNFFVTLDKNRFNELFTNLNLGDKIEVLFLNQDGIVLYSSDESKEIGSAYPYADLVQKIVTDSIENSSGSFDMNLKNFSYCSYYHIDSTPFYVVTVTPYSYLNSAANVIGYSIIFAAIIILALSIILGLVISNSISKHLGKLVNLMRKAKIGDLTEVITDNGKDEIGEVIANYVDMIKNIKNLIEKVHVSVNNVITSAERISTSSEQTLASSQQIAITLQEVAKGASEQAQEVSQTVEYMNDLSDSINKMSEKLGNMSNLISNTEVTSIDAITKVQLLNDRANQTKEASQKIVDEISSLNNDMKQISKITKLIVGISDQTNLLSLNAAIEAARAGEAGRGFAVVADEVKKLADQTKEASIMINNIIREINIKSEHAVLEANNTSNIVQEQMAAVEQTNDAFNTISASMKEITAYMNELEKSVGDMLTLRQKTLSSMENISAVSQEAAATSEEVSASTEEQMANSEVLANLAKEMDKMAKELQSAVSMFKIK